MPTTILIDYGSGNLRSAEKALVRAAGGLSGAHRVLVSDDPDAIARADRLVLPGVGAFAACMGALQARDGATAAMTQAVRGRGAPFLGICVGMQLLADRGLEFGTHPGLGWIGGEVRRLAPGAAAAKVPHVGWNEVTPLVGPPHPLLAGLRGSTMYFTHSFAFSPNEVDVTAAITDHGGPFSSVVAKENVAGVQFHPEKSQGAGLRLIANFLEWRP